MTVSSQVSRVSYLGDGVTTLLPVPYYFLEPEHLLVTQLNVNGSSQTLILGSDYSVSGAGNPAGGSITRSVAATIGVQTIIERVVPATQETDYVANDPFPAESHERALDKLTMLVQQNARGLTKAIRVPDTDPDPARLPNVAGRAGKFMSFDGAGNPVAAAAPTDSPSNIVARLADAFTAANGAGMSGFDWQTTYAEGTVGGTLRNMRNIRRYGAIADNGTTNDIATFQAAALSGPGIIDARGLLNCRLDGTITCGAGQTWLLAGSNFVTSNNSNDTVFLISVVPNVSIIGPYKATGLGGSSANGASFIRINDAIDWLIDSPRIYDMPGYGIYITPGAGTSDRAKHGEIRNPIIRGCNIGILDTAGTGAEYYTIVNPMITFCPNTGLATNAGNVIVLGGHIVDNADGVFMSGPGNNHSHGMFVGVNINHNTNFNVNADHVTNGETFVGCHFYGGSAGTTGEIFLNNCRGIRFHGGHLACRVYNYETDGSAGVNWIEDMFCLGTYGEVQLLDDVGARPKNLIVRDCYGPGSTVSGISINDPSPLYVHARREATTTQALSGATTLLFPVEQANGDRRRAHDPATGVTTIPAIMEGGQYRISANLYFTATSGMAAAGSNVQILINGTPRRLFVPDIFSATVGTCPIIAEIFLNPGDTVSIRATMTGTGVLFGGATWDSAFSIERIA